MPLFFLSADDITWWNNYVREFSSPTEDVVASPALRYNVDVGITKHNWNNNELTRIFDIFFYKQFYIYTFIINTVFCYELRDQRFQWTTKRTINSCFAFVKTGINRKII